MDLVRLFFHPQGSASIKKKKKERKKKKKRAEKKKKKTKIKTIAPSQILQNPTDANWWANIETCFRYILFNVLI